MFLTSACATQMVGRAYQDETDALAAANSRNRLVQPEEIGAIVAFRRSDAAPALTMEDIQMSPEAQWR